MSSPSKTSGRRAQRCPPPPRPEPANRISFIRQQEQCRFLAENPLASVPNAGIEFGLGTRLLRNDARRKPDIGLERVAVILDLVDNRTDFDPHGLSGKETPVASHEVPSADADSYDPLIGNEASARCGYVESEGERRALCRFLWILIITHRTLESHHDSTIPDGWRCDALCTEARLRSRLGNDFLLGCEPRRARQQ